MQLVIATNNRDKIKEIRELLDDLPITILTRDDYLEFPDPEETGTTLEENAAIKAKAIAEFTGHPALADDSGLEVDALDGSPGVFSSRYAGVDCSYRDNNEKLIRELAGVAPEARTARFRCVIAIAWDEETIEYASGQADGLIADDIAEGEGFGYDPVFYFPPADKRFSQMTTEEKNKISHRGLALIEAQKLIITRLSSSTQIT